MSHFKALLSDRRGYHNVVGWRKVIGSNRVTILSVTFIKAVVVKTQTHPFCLLHVYDVKTVIRSLLARELYGVLCPSQLKLES